MGAFVHEKRFAFGTTVNIDPVGFQIVWKRLFHRKEHGMFDQKAKDLFAKIGMEIPPVRTAPSCVT